MRTLRRAALPIVAVPIVIAMLGLGCSDDSASSSTIDSTSPTNPTNGVPPTSTSAPASAPVSSTAPGDSVPVTASVLVTASVPVTAVESGGWRMVITAPTTAATVGNPLSISYEITGESREPGLALDVSLAPVGSVADALPVRVGVPVGRGSVDVDVTVLATGVYDLWVRLVVDDQPLAEAVVKIVGVEFSA